MNVPPVISWLRSQIGLVGQEAVLFTGTIEENIKLGYGEATTEQVIEAARQANCHDFIMTFPEGYQTQVGEGGTLVSGGQKQRYVGMKFRSGFHFVGFRLN